MVKDLAQSISLEAGEIFKQLDAIQQGVAEVKCITRVN
jgi:hypothetical protein